MTLPLNAACLVGLLLFGTAAAAEEAFEPITPFRPSVSNSAQLPAAGQLELEFGGLRERSDDMRRVGTPYLLKLAFDKEWGILLGGEVHVWQRDANGRAQGWGDTTLTVRRAWIVDEESAFGLELGAKLPTAKDAIGGGKTDATLNGIYSRDFGPIHVDANLNATRLGLVEPGTSRTQLGASAAVSTALSANWNLIGELSGTRRSGSEHTSQLLAAVTYSPSKLLTFDLGIARARHPSPATNSIFAGVVFPLAKLW